MDGSLKQMFLGFSSPGRKKRRHLWLFEIVLAVALFALCAPLFALTCRSLYQKRLKDLRTLQGQHLISLVWYEVLQNRWLEKEGITWKGFDKAQKIALPEKRVTLDQGQRVAPFHYTLTFECRGKKSRFAHRRIICAKLALWNEGQLNCQTNSERWLLLPRVI